MSTERDAERGVVREARGKRGEDSGRGVAESFKKEIKSNPIFKFFFLNFVFYFNYY